MNWYVLAQYPDLVQLYKEARELRPESTHWAKETYMRFVQPIIPDLTDRYWRKISRLWETGGNFHKSLIPLREKFMNSLKNAFRAAVGLAKGNPKAFGQQAADLVKRYLDVSGNAYGENLAHGRMSVSNNKQGYEKYVLPHLSKYKDFDSWWRQTTSAGKAGNRAIKNPMNNRGYAGKAPVGANDFKDNMEYRGVAKAWNDFSTLLRTDQANVAKLDAAGRRVAAASDRLFASTLMPQTETNKRVDMFAQYLSPAMPEVFPNTPQGKERFNNSLRPNPKETSAISNWKRENRFLLHETWSHPPYRNRDGSLSGSLQKLIAHLKARPVALKPMSAPPKQDIAFPANGSTPPIRFPEDRGMAAAPNHLAPALV